MGIGDLFFEPKERECRCCEILQDSLNRERALTRELLDKLLHKDEPKEISPVKHEPILPVLVPWRVKRAQLESESRQKAKALTETEQREVERVEKELKLEIPDDATGSQSSS